MATENTFLFDSLFLFDITDCELENLGHLIVTHRNQKETVCAFGKLGVFTNSDSLVNFANLFKYLNYVELERKATLDNEKERKGKRTASKLAYCDTWSVSIIMIVRQQVTVETSPRMGV